MEATSGPVRTPRVNLLWTGGWDSTFRLLQLLLVHRVEVAPYYLKDPTRASTDIELKTMAGIIGVLHARYPHTRELLQPLHVAEVSKLPTNPEFATALAEVRRRNYIGSQYVWLPAFCRQHGIDDMEIGVHVDDRVQSVLRTMVTEFDHPAGFRSVRVDPKHADTPEYRLFGSFSFPLFLIDKVEISRQANGSDWGDIMEMTWFCHTPVRGKPCGTCGPCVYTIQEGLARRVPMSRRALSFFYRRLLLPFKDPLRHARASLRRHLSGRREAATGTGHS